MNTRSEYLASAGNARSAGGFTLVEVLLSSGIAAIIMVSLVSVMMLAQRGLAEGAAVSDSAFKSDRAIQMIVQDINLATSITEHTDKAITLQVPDRNGNGTSETIRYAWSGIGGDPLTKQVNGGTPGVVAEKIYQLKLTYLNKTLTAAQ